MIFQVNLRFLNFLTLFQRAGDEARTRDLQLGRLSLYQLSYSRKIFFNSWYWWGEKDSNLRSRKTTDLQSVPVGRFGISPNIKEQRLLRYKTPPKVHCKLSHLPESNQRPTDYKSVALPAELKWLDTNSRL